MEVPERCIPAMHTGESLALGPSKVPEISDSKLARVRMSGRWRTFIFNPKAQRFHRNPERLLAVAISTTPAVTNPFAKAARSYIAYIHVISFRVYLRCLSFARERSLFTGIRGV